MSSFTFTTFHSLVSRLHALSPGGKARAGLLVLLALEVVFLALGEKPWNVELPEGRKPRLADHVTIYAWFAALGNLAVTLVLFVSASWWTRPVTVRPETAVRPTRWFWPLVAVAMAAAALWATPRLDRSLWDDEEYNVRYSILGRFHQEDGPDEPRFKHVKWLDTLYDYREPNNHVLHSILARLCLDTWRAVARPAGLPFTEWPLRIPALMFGLAAVAATAWLTREFFGPRAGVVAAFLLALHPWLIRYASEARGYSMILCFLPMAAVLWKRSLTQGRWKWWILYGGVQWAALYTYPGVLPVFALLNLAALAILWGSARVAGPAAAQTGRWFAVNSFAAMGVLQLMAPLYPQAQAYFAYESARSFTIGWSWVRSTLSFLAAGVPWAGETSHHPSLTASLPDGTLRTVVLALIGAAAAAGLVRLCRRGGIGAALAASILVPPLLTFGISVARHHLIYSSYIIYALPGLVVFAAAGLEGAARLLDRVPAGRFLAPGLLVLAVGGFESVTAATRRSLATRPLQPIKDSVLISRGTLDYRAPGQERILTASFSIPPYLYDGRMERLSSADDFIALMRRADAENKTLVVNIGMPWAARAYSPKMWKLFTHPELFHERVHLHGFDSGLDRIVATYIPGRAARFDFEPYAGPGR